jgi:Tat protein translocase TatB subunit
MLDIGFSELLVIGGVALVVLGPEKLAVVARAAGKWTGKAQRYVNDVKADIAREGELAELRKLKTEMEATGRDVGASLRSSANAVQTDLSAIQTTVTQDLTPAPVMNEQQVQASIQASLDSASHASEYIPPAIDMTGRYQSGLDSTLSPPPLHDPIAQRMELESLQDDLTRLENRMVELKRSLNQASKAPA